MEKDQYCFINNYLDIWIAIRKEQSYFLVTLLPLYSNNKVRMANNTSLWLLQPFQWSLRSWNVWQQQMIEPLPLPDPLHSGAKQCHSPVADASSADSGLRSSLGHGLLTAAASPHHPSRTQGHPKCGWKGVPRRKTTKESLKQIIESK